MTSFLIPPIFVFLVDIDTSLVAPRTTNDQATPELPIISEDVLIEIACPISTDLPDLLFLQRTSLRKLLAKLLRLLHLQFLLLPLLRML